MTSKDAARVLYAFSVFVPPGEAWKDRGIISASVFRLGDHNWTLIILFRDKSYFKYIPDTFGKLRVTKRSVG